MFLKNYRAVYAILYGGVTTSFNNGQGYEISNLLGFNPINIPIVRNFIESNRLLAVYFYFIARIGEMKTCNIFLRFCLLSDFRVTEGIP